MLSGWGAAEKSCAASPQPWPAAARTKGTLSAEENDYQLAPTSRERQGQLAGCPSDVNLRLKLIVGAWNYACVRSVARS